MDQLTKEGTCARPSCPNRAQSGHRGHCEKHSRWLGIVQHKVPIAKSRQRIQRLLDEGYALSAIGKAAGVEWRTVSNIMDGTYSTVRKSTEAKILTAQPKVGKPSPWPLERRIQALRAAGMTIREIAEGAGFSPRTVSMLSEGEYGCVEWKTDRRVREFYTAHEMDPVRPASPQVAKRGWPLPFDWHDIDDPDERRGLLAKEHFEDMTPVTPDLVDAAQWLINAFDTLRGASHAAGVSNTALPRIVKGGSPTVTREYAHRIAHAARREGWAPPAQGLSAAA